MKEMEFIVVQFSNYKWSHNMGVKVGVSQGTGLVELEMLFWKNSTTALKFSEDGEFLT